jgi:hypothetical protein
MGRERSVVTDDERLPGCRDPEYQLARAATVGVGGRDAGRAGPLLAARQLLIGFRRKPGVAAAALEMSADRLHDADRQSLESGRLVEDARDRILRGRSSVGATTGQRRAEHARRGAQRIELRAPFPRRDAVVESEESPALAARDHGDDGDRRDLLLREDRALAFREAVDGAVNRFPARQELAPASEAGGDEVEVLELRVCELRGHAGRCPLVALTGAQHAVGIAEELEEIDAAHIRGGAEALEDIADVRFPVGIVEEARRGEGHGAEDRLARRERRFERTHDAELPSRGETIHGETHGRGLRKMLHIV